MNELIEGAWKDDKRHGKGHREYVSGDTYTGDWVNNNREGHGVYVFKSGGRYAILHSHDMLSVFSFLFQAFI